MIRRLLSLAAVPLMLAAAPPPDWRAVLRSDARALHDDVAANHPGPVNASDPGFARRNDAGLALALRRAEKVRDYPGYWYAMNAYVASFNDGHVGFWAEREAPAATYRWPGFLTRLDEAGAQTVAISTDPAIPVGARLIGCDGMAAAPLVAAQVGAFVGRWFLPAQRQRLGNRLFVDDGNPYRRLPERCTFTSGGTRRSVKLAWRAIDKDGLQARLTETGGRAHPPIAARTLADGTRWYALSDFDGDPASSGGKALPGLIAGMARDRAAWGTAPAIVLDLRGNDGGTSDWSRQIAEVLWGKAAVAAAQGRGDVVDWRASAANIASLTATRDARLTLLSPEERDWFAQAIAGMAAARARGASFWREVDPAVTAAPSAAPLRLPRVFFVTDLGCASACLDAADLWLALGAVQVGQETSADTLYMDVRERVLPSGWSGLAVPMKVYRGRARGSNVPLRPRWRFAGDLRDTAALEAWVATLPR